MQNQEHHNSSLEDNLGGKNSVWLFFWDLAKVFVTAFVLVWLVIRPFIAEPFIVSGSSMVPNFHNRDYLIIEKLSYRAHLPVRGEVIVFRYPQDPKQYFIKRIIGLPGDTIRIGGGKVYLRAKASGGEQAIDETYLPTGLKTELESADSVWQLGPEQYFVLGDNRGHSSDSRAWGVVPSSYIVGRAWLRVLPLKNVGVIEHANLP